MSTVPMPETMNLSQFAAHAGFKRSYATQLKNEGRLVMSPDGRRVLVAESLARIETTRDPSKQGVAQRHADGRGAAALTGHETEIAKIAEKIAETVIGQEEPNYDYQTSKAKREHWAAEREHAAFRKEAEELMERTEVIAMMADAGATLRSQLEALASTLAPQLAGRDESVIRATIADNVERVLSVLTEKFSRVQAND